MTRFRIAIYLFLILLVSCTHKQEQTSNEPDESPSVTEDHNSLLKDYVNRPKDRAKAVVDETQRQQGRVDSELEDIDRGSGVESEEEDDE